MIHKTYLVVVIISSGMANFVSQRPAGGGGASTDVMHLRHSTI